MLQETFWQGKKVLITGHTGFKGSWLCIWLHTLGARVTGYALAPPSQPNLFESCGIHSLVESVTADVRDLHRLSDVVAQTRPEIIIHMAAQSLVRESYDAPVETYDTNVMGTVNLLEAVRKTPGVKAVINVTSDKCYENIETLKGYHENKTLGGHDPYSNSKACSELVTRAFRSSFFHPDRYNTHGVALATARAGNVIGGGDWATDRLVPDCIRAMLKKETILLRFPQAVRPWQHVLEPLRGYLMLAEKLYLSGPQFSGAWNFGPAEEDTRTVLSVVKKLCVTWGAPEGYALMDGNHPHEAGLLKLDCSKARERLGFNPYWHIDIALEKVVAWAKARERGEDMLAFSQRQIAQYQEEGH
ncbi:CDP-glucose 4,6-dehydratase [Desulfoluna butyratoxydans]|uniref:Cdp-glucose 4 6-dehydratase n=1 Tax=Desulfoluna butyratoxydans TaxID=231438 RepID=A0A4U8YTU2_9BACT|nr:CDP-glucose 4,6-dehydratase [Desulfoluna butyratoxydans]VFQ47294.1 cdp-glucose 4 6-dehydratase [Desulfoluna butyratoxydans]